MPTLMVDRPVAGDVEAVEVTVADGRRAVFRILTADDADALADAVGRADPDDLRKRFMGVAPPARRVAAFLRRADGVHDLLLGAFDENGRIIGVAQFDRLNDGPCAEIAVEVAKSWQRQGLGRHLMIRLSELARERGVHEFRASYYADNEPIRRLLAEVGRRVSGGTEHGESYVCLAIDPPTAA